MCAGGPGYDSVSPISLEEKSTSIMPVSKNTLVHRFLSVLETYSLVNTFQRFRLVIVLGIVVQSYS